MVNADKRTRTSETLQPHVELFLAGDFSSPLEVLASQDMSARQKREILEFWRDDLDAKLHIREVRILHRSVVDALASLQMTAGSEDGS